MAFRGLPLTFHLSTGLPLTFHWPSTHLPLTFHSPSTHLPLTFHSPSTACHQVLFFSLSLIICVLFFLNSALRAILFENPFELINGFFIGLYCAGIAMSFLEFHVGNLRCTFEFEKTLGNKCGSPPSPAAPPPLLPCMQALTAARRPLCSRRCEGFSSCLPAIVQLGLFASIFVCALVVVRDFGWRAYRKFGATARGQSLKQMYRKRMIFFSCLKVDLCLSLLMVVAIACFMFNDSIWPDSSPIAAPALFISLLLRCDLPRAPPISPELPLSSPDVPRSASRRRSASCGRASSSAPSSRRSRSPSRCSRWPEIASDGL